MEKFSDKNTLQIHIFPTKVCSCQNDCCYGAQDDHDHSD